jgi:hypothetical protein
MQTSSRLPWRPCSGEVSSVYMAVHVFLCIPSANIVSGNVVQVEDSELFEFCCVGSGPEH